MELRTDYNYDDNELVYLISENNEEAKDALYKKYSAMIHKELNRVKKTAFALDMDWSDLMQEALLGFSGAINTYNQENDVKFSTYATLCVRRKLINYVEKNRTAKNFALKNAVSLDIENEKSNIDYSYFLRDLSGKEPLNKLVTDESITEVLDHFGADLTSEEKAIMELSIDGKKPEEIANIMNMSIKKVYNSLYRARKKLKDNK